MEKDPLDWVIWIGLAIAVFELATAIIQFHTASMQM